jgi:hypothetical protein
LWMAMRPQSFFISVVSVSVGTPLAAPADADARAAQLHTVFGVLLIAGILLHRFFP